MGRNGRLELDDQGNVVSFSPPTSDVSYETAEMWLERMEWHCQGRHGVLRAVAQDDVEEAKESIGFFLGHGGDFAKANPDGTWDIEFVHMTKVWPPPKSADGWCGTSVLWPRRKGIWL